MPITRIPSPDEFAHYRVTNPNSSEVVRQPLYDYQLLAGTGAQSLTFFQTPIGAGITTALGATVGTPKTLSDTNMVLAAQLPSGLQFMVESIEVLFYPGSVSTANTYTPAGVAFFAAVAALSLAALINDANTFYQSGLLKLTVLAKDYLTITPTIQAVPRASFDLSAAFATNSATTSEVGAGILRPGGEPLFLDPPIALFPAQNFNVTISWPAVVALPSGFNARVGVQLAGFQYRAGQ